MAHRNKENRFTFFKFLLIFHIFLYSSTPTPCLLFFYISFPVLCISFFPFTKLSYIFPPSSLQFIPLHLAFLFRNTSPFFFSDSFFFLFPVSIRNCFPRIRNHLIDQKLLTASCRIATNRKEH